MRRKSPKSAPCQTDGKELKRLEPKPVACEVLPEPPLFLLLGALGLARKYLVVHMLPTSPHGAFFLLRSSLGKNGIIVELARIEL